MSNRKRASSPNEDKSSTARKTTTDSRPSTSAFNAAEDDIGEWEDRYEDEYESEDIVTDDSADSDDDDIVAKDSSEVREAGQQVSQMDLDSGANAEDGEEGETMPYLPQLGQGDRQLAEDEELVPDMSSYVLLHHARLAWPCLSFDVLRDVSLLFDISLGWGLI